MLDGSPVAGNNKQSSSAIAVDTKTAPSLLPKNNINSGTVMSKDSKSETTSSDDKNQLELRKKELLAVKESSLLPSKKMDEELAVIQQKLDALKAGNKEKDNTKKLEADRKIGGEGKNSSDTKAEVNVNTNYEYGGDDITDYVNLIIENELGGFRDKKGEVDDKDAVTKHTYLLTKDDDKKKEIILYTSAVDVVGGAYPIDYYLDKTKLERNNLAIVLELIIPNLNNLKSLDDEALRLYIKSQLINNDFISSIVNQLKSENFIESELSKKINLLRREGNHKVAQAIKDLLTTKLDLNKAEYIILNTLNKADDAILFEQISKQLVDESFVDTVMKELRVNCKFDEDKIRNKIRESDERKKYRDAFDEAMPAVRKFGDNCSVKILFPYNRTNVHWLAGEIEILKRGNYYDVKIYAHDPYGNGEMDGSNYKTLILTITKRIQAEHNKLFGQIPTITTEGKPGKSSYGRRQLANDNKSCGVIAAEDIVKLIKGESLDIEKPYEIGASALRTSHVNKFKQYRPVNDPTRINFINRNTIAVAPLPSPEANRSLSLGKDEIDRIIHLIKNIRNEKLKEGILQSLGSRNTSSKSDEMYVLAIKKALTSNLDDLKTAGIVLDDQDVKAIAEVNTSLFDEKGKIKGNAELIYLVGKAANNTENAKKENMLNAFNQYSNSRYAFSSNDMSCIGQIIFKNNIHINTPAKKYVFLECSSHSFKEGDLSIVLKKEENNLLAGKKLVGFYYTQAGYWITFTVETNMGITRVLYKDSTSTLACSDFENKLKELYPKNLKIDSIYSAETLDSSDSGIFALYNLEPLIVGDMFTGNMKASKIQFYHPAQSPKGYRATIDEARNGCAIKYAECIYYATMNETTFKNISTRHQDELPLLKNYFNALVSNNKNISCELRVNLNSLNCDYIINCSKDYKDRVIEIANGLTNSRIDVVEKDNNEIEITIQPKNIDSNKAEDLVEAFKKNSASKFEERNHSADVTAFTNKLHIQWPLSEAIKSELNDKLGITLKNPSPIDSKSLLEQRVKKTAAYHLNLDERHKLFMAEDITSLERVIEQIHILAEIGKDFKANKENIKLKVAEIGRLIKGINWDEEDAECIRNKYGYINRYKKASNARNKIGIDFEQIGHLGDIFSKDYGDKELQMQMFEAGYVDLMNGFEKLGVYLQKILLKEKDGKEFTLAETGTLSSGLKQITTFTAFFNDRRCLKNILRFIDPGSARDLKELDLKNNIFHRYYFGRILVLIGESAKNISDPFRLKDSREGSKQWHFASLLTAMGKLRDVIKLSAKLVKEPSKKIDKMRIFFNDNADAIASIIEELLLSMHNNIVEGDIHKTWINCKEFYEKEPILIIDLTIRLYQHIKDLNKKIRALQKPPSKNPQATTLVVSKPKVQPLQKKQDNVSVVEEELNKILMRILETYNKLSPIVWKSKILLDIDKQIKSAIALIKTKNQSKMLFLIKDYLTDRKKELMADGISDDELKHIDLLKRMLFNYNECLEKAVPIFSAQELSKYPAKVNSFSDFIQINEAVIMTIKAVLSSSSNEPAKVSNKFDAKEDEKHKQPEKQPKEDVKQSKKAKDKAEDNKTDNKTSTFIDILIEESTFLKNLNAGKKQLDEDIYSRARELAIGFLGQALKEYFKSQVQIINSKGKLHPEFKSSFERIITTRHKQIMHDIFSQDDASISKLVKEDIEPWEIDFNHMIHTENYGELFDNMRKHFSDVSATADPQTLKSFVAMAHLSGDAALRSGKVDEAIECYTIVLERGKPLIEDKIMYYAYSRTLISLYDCYRIKIDEVNIINVVIKGLEELMPDGKPSQGKHTGSRIANTLGNAYSFLHRFEEAINWLDKALELANDEKTRLTILINKAINITSIKGRESEGLKLLEDNIEAVVKVDVILAFNSYLAIAQTHQPLDSKASNNCCIKALAIYEKNIGAFKEYYGADFVTRKIKILLVQASLFIGSDKKKALEILNVAYVSIQPLFKEETSLEFNNIAEVVLSDLLSISPPHQKVDLENEHIKILERLCVNGLNQENHRFLQNCNRLGLYYKEKKNPKALKYYTKAYDVLKKSFDNDKVNLIATINNIVTLHLDLKNYKEARIKIAEGMVILSKAPKGELLVKECNISFTLYSARSYLEEGNLIQYEIFQNRAKYLYDTTLKGVSGVRREITEVFANITYNISLHFPLTMGKMEMGDMPKRLGPWHPAQHISKKIEEYILTNFDKAFNGAPINDSSIFNCRFDINKFSKEHVNKFISDNKKYFENAKLVVDSQSGNYILTVEAKKIKEFKDGLYKASEQLKKMRAGKLISYKDW